ncbi:MAG: helix-turn-helix domain-containing protein, partial [Candidatus Angelobacter sp.]
HHGFNAELWTLPRVAAVVERVTGVRYHPGHIWKILGSMNWTVQKPERQAKERDAAKVQYWKEVRWRDLKKTLSASKPGSSSKTNPVSRNSPPSAPVGRRAAKPRS